MSASGEKSPPIAPKIPSRAKKHQCLNMCKLLLAALPSIAFGIFTIIFTVQQNHAADENRKQDQQQAEERSIRTTFENYINDVSALLLDQKFSRNNSEHLLHIRVKTLTVLRHVDANRKRDIILFLYESRLLRSDRPTAERLNLIDAQLDGIEFVGLSAVPFQLDHLYLPGVYVSNAVFCWCQLNYAVFDLAVMSNVKIINSTIAYASFRRIYAPNLTMGDLMYRYNNFTGATLVRTHFIGEAGWREKIDLTNVDLLGSHALDQQLLDFNNVWLHGLDIRNTRLPDGSFGRIDSSQLVIDSGAEESCPVDGSQGAWLPGIDLLSIEMIGVTSNSSLAASADNDTCYFLARSPGTSSLSQLIDVHFYTILIDSGQARYNLSAFIDCIGNGSSTAAIHIAFLRENNLYIAQHSVFSAMTTLQQSNYRTGQIPEHTRMLQLELHASLIDASAFCIIDDVRLNIFYQRK